MEVGSREEQMIRVCGVGFVAGQFGASRDRGASLCASMLLPDSDRVAVRK